VFLKLSLIISVQNLPDTLIADYRIATDFIL